MTTKKHYENHLANFYSWMTGDFETKQKEFQFFLEEQGIIPSSSKMALDLGAGHGIQSAALAKLGFKVWAIDFNKQLLDELIINCEGLDVTAVEQDMRLVTKYEDLDPEVIVCWGDTLTHLESESDIERFIEYSCDLLSEGSKFILSFRNYSEKRIGDSRFIPVKSDANRILTCFLDYTPTHVVVTDLLHEFNGNTWEQKVSSYNKYRISGDEIIDLLEENNMTVTYHKELNGLITIVATK
ncbi:class I SAM-dependent methyltransferase [Aurantibacillus circumpalustris]|uniref:class I SAM-dependent methyltransferase n=1 Tax=Aurantibacillus circumpalustris TaxID=3036359 RepID=UPI00295BEFFE|nr:class I SAM-dependent methyltransferase [Aurantibacillus circumpalustris]